MTRMLRTLALALVLLPFATVAEAQLAPGDAAGYIGNWTLTLDSPQGPFEQNVVFKDEAGKVVAELSNQMQPDAQKVTDITKTGADLVLKFSGNFQGNPFDAVITMTPDGTDKVKVVFDVNSGMFTMNGTGTKK
ncbi:MAG TPA: hypothetical protein VEC39_16440 [Vicinamibacterales bacterium]|nr:hypothetical protein [Vicinamibacterales bacterium]